MGELDEQALRDRIQEILSEISALDHLLQEQDYIGVKIAMGRATKEDYADEIAKSEQWAQRKNELEDELKQLMENGGNENG